MSRAGHWLRQGADWLGALIFAAMFVAFLIQVMARYVFGSPVSWTFELSLLAYIWLIFWAASAMLPWDRHIAFTLVFDLSGPVGRRVMGMVGAMAVLALMLLALPATVDWIDFMKIEKTSVFKFRLNYVYAIFALFMAAAALRAAWGIWRLARPGWRDRI